MGLTSGTRPMAAATPHRPATTLPWPTRPVAATRSRPRTTPCWVTTPAASRPPSKTATCWSRNSSTMQTPAHDDHRPENQQVTIAYTGRLAQYHRPGQPRHQLATTAQPTDRHHRPGHQRLPLRLRLTSKRLNALTDPDTNTRVSATTNAKVSSIARPGTTANP